MILRPHTVMVFATLVVLLTVQEACADDGQGTAEALFQEGRALMDQGKLADACKAFEDSLKLERGVGTLLNLAKCYELQGKPATAWQTYGDSAELAQAQGDDKRTALAEAQQERIAPRIPQAVITVEGVTESTVVALDGTVLDPPATDTPLPLDPGTHTVTVEEEGKLSRTITFRVARLREGETRRTRVFVAALEPAPARSPEVESPRHQTTSGSRHSALQWVGFSALGIGMATGGAGVFLGFRAKNQEDQADCDSNDFCSPEGLEQRQSARAMLNTGYVLGVAGAGLAVAGGITLVVAGLKETKSQQQLQAGVTLRDGPRIQISGSF